MAEITLKDVWKNYGSVEAVKGISFSCREGEFIAILGPSGCGKTSTLRMIAGLEEITDGEIKFDGNRVNELSPKDRDVAMAFEDYALYPALSVFDNISFPLKAPHRAHLYTKANMNEKVRDLATMLDLTDILDSKVTKLSGGQQQRISLARALIRPARVYVLDEPLSHLDARQQIDVRASLRRMQQIEKSTMILVTHNQAEALSMADRVVLMNRGEIMQIGTPWAIWNEPSNLFVADFIGDPPMNFLSARFDTDKCQFSTKHFDIEALPEITEAAKARTQDCDYTIGIRPDDFSFSLTSVEGYSIFGDIWVVEPMGDETIVTIACGEQRVKVIVPGDLRLETGRRLWLKPNLLQVHIFDNSTGHSLRNKAA